MKDKLLSKRTLLILFALSLPAFLTLIRPGYFPMHDDIQGMRVLQMAKCLKDLQIPCRWVPDMGYGYGYPQFNFYAPLAYYVVSPLVLLGASVLESVKVMFALSVVGSSIGMYLLGSYFWGKRGGILSALFYIYAPYRAVNMYVRGAVGELWGIMFLPFIFYFTLRLLEGKKKYILPLALSVAGLLLSHNITAVMILPFYAIFVLLSKKLAVKNILNLGLAGVWGFGISAFFTLPAFLEKEYAHVETILQGYFNYLAHFISLKQMFVSTFWGYGSSTLGPLDGMSFTVGFMHVVVSVWALGLFIVLAKHSKIKSLVLFLVLAGLALFMAHNKSVFIWDSIALLSYIQFPWRFLAIATFFLSLSTGALMASLSESKNLKSILVASFFFALLLFYGSFFKPQKWLTISDQEKFSGKNWQQQQTISIFDYLPIYAEYPPTQGASDSPVMLRSGGFVVNGEKGTDWQKWEVEIFGSSEDVELQQFYFPGWEAKIDDKVVPINYDNDLGLMMLSVPQGQHKIEIRLKDTNLRLFANLLSVISIILIPVYLRKAK